jgi:hypothetical protein
MVGTKIGGMCRIRNDSVKHRTQGQAINAAEVNTKADDSPDKLVHDLEPSMAIERDGFAAKQNDTPKTIYHTTNKDELRRTIARLWRLIFSQHASFGSAGSTTDDTSGG